MKPNLGRGADRVITAAVLVENEHGDYRTCLCGGMQSGVIGHAQIAPEPDDLGRTHDSGTEARGWWFHTA